MGHTAAKEKDAIITSYSQPDSTIRLHICTVAFGMGMGVPDIRRKIHWLPAEDIETYVQECGRAGRDGLLAEACLCFHSTDLTSHTIAVGVDMVKYCTNNSECRRSLLAHMFECAHVFVPQQRCCDVCAGNEDTSHHSSPSITNQLSDLFQRMEVSDVSIDKVRKALQEYRDALCPPGIPLILGVELSTDLTPAILDILASKSSTFTCADDLMALVPISRSVAVDLFKVIYYTI